MHLTMAVKLHYVLPVGCISKRRKGKTSNFTFQEQTNYSTFRIDLKPCPSRTVTLFKSKDECPQISAIHVPGKSCLVGALIWARLSTRQATSGLDPLRMVQKPGVFFTPSGELLKSKTLSTSTGSAVRQNIESWDQSACQLHW